MAIRRDLNGSEVPDELFGMSCHDLGRLQCRAVLLDKRQQMLRSGAVAANRVQR